MVKYEMEGIYECFIMFVDMKNKQHKYTLQL
jgi:hypothetical protein